MIRYLILLLLAASCGHAAAADWYVSPTGSPQGNGTLESPWDLATAIGHRDQQAATKHQPDRLPPQLQPGDTIWLRGGRYVGFFDSHLHSGMVLRSHPGEWAVIDQATPIVRPNGGRRFFVWGAGSVYRELEFCSSGNRRTDAVGSHAADISLGSLTNYADNVDYIDLVCHDLAGVSSFKSGGRILGGFYYLNGWLGKNINGGPNPHGHGLYVQNFGTAGVLKEIRGVMSFANFGYGLHFYAQEQGKAGLKNLLVEDCVFFEGGGGVGDGHPHFPNVILGGSAEQVDNATMRRVYTWQKARDGVTRIGYPFAGFRTEKAVTIEDSYFADGRFDLIHLPDPFRTTGTTIVGRIESNTFQFGATNAVLSADTGVRIFHTFHPLEPAKSANLVVYNWDALPTVAWDMSRLGLVRGQSWTVFAVPHFGTPWQSGIYDPTATTVQLSMAPRTLPTPAGYVDAAGNPLRAPVVLPEMFGAFRVTFGPVPSDPTEPTDPTDPNEPDPPPEAEFTEVRLFRERATGKLFIEEAGVKKPL